ncbi:MAG: hypothetical protein JRG67_08345 [Deltaproteobacteria bacterium]|nr:hypothetical protein [Deltaproteobacteria bacterium]
MISAPQTTRLLTLCATLLALAACGDGSGVIESENAIIDPPAQCSSGRPDCWVSQDFPDGSDLNATNSAGLRFSDDTGSLVVDRVSSLPDSDGDGVPDDADDCPGMPGWRVPCDGDAANDGLYQTVFFDPSGAAEATRTSIATTIADIPQIDVYFLVDATPTLAEEIAVLQAEILNIIDDVRANFPDAQFGLGLYREYPLAPLAPAHSQAPYHHILDLTDDEVLVQTAVSTLNTVSNATPASAATQALFTVASGLGLGDMVPNRGSCPNAPEADVGYPCFRADALHVVMNITDAEVTNGPRGFGTQYGDPPFEVGVGAGTTNLPPVEMFPSLLGADSAVAALDLGDLSAKSLTLMGMSTLLSDQVNTAIAPGCVSPPPIPPDPPGGDMDGNDVVLALRFDSAVLGATAFANNTHWPGANVALFDNALLDPLMALECDGGATNIGMWGLVNWAPVTSQQYYLVADGIIPASDPGHMPKGAFSISIVHDGDPANPTWLTSDAPAAWTDVETALLASDIRVASVVTLRDAMDIVSDGNDDARLMAAATGALTKVNGEWVTELASANGEGLDSAISNTIALAKTDSVYDISMVAVDNDDPTVDEADFILVIRHHDCAQGDPFECDSGSGNTCIRCDLGAFLEYEVVFMNTSVPPTGASQVFDFSVAVSADDSVAVEWIPVRVMVPDADAHDFDDLPGANFYRNDYDSTLRCTNRPETRPEHPKWGDLTWTGSTPTGSSIEFQIRTANAVEDLQTAVPASVVISSDTTGTTDTTTETLNLGNELIADGQVNGLPYIQITAVLNPSNTQSQTPTLEGWSFEFVCEAAE